MTKEDLTKTLSKYENTDKKYYHFLMRLVVFCTGDLRTILSEAEQTNKKTLSNQRYPARDGEKRTNARKLRFN